MPVVKIDTIGGKAIYDTLTVDQKINAVRNELNDYKQEIADMAKGYTVVTKLGDPDLAVPGVIYYLDTGKKVTEIAGYRRARDPEPTNDLKDTPDSDYTIPVYIERPALDGYLLSKDKHTGHNIWHTITNNLNELNPLSQDEIDNLWRSIARPEVVMLNIDNALALKDID